MIGKLLSFNVVLVFAISFWRPHVGIVLVAAFMILLSAGLNVIIPQLARDIAAFNSNNNNNVEIIEEYRFFPTLFVFSFSDLKSRCLLMVLVIIAYHLTSFMGHKIAYLAGQRIYSTIVESVMVALLRTPHLDRIALIGPVKLSQIILSSAQTSADVAGALLTDVLASLCGTVALFGILVHMSLELTVTIVLVLLGLQFLLQTARQHHHNREKELALAESDVQILTTNALHRSATVRVFQAEPLVLSGLRKRLKNVLTIKSDVITGIHGQACFSSIVAGILFVFVLGMTNIYRQRGLLNMVDIAIYYMVLYQFIIRIQSLQHDCRRTLVLLEGLYTLQQLVSWYEVEHLVQEQLFSSNCSATAEKLVQATYTEENPSNRSDGNKVIALEDVTYIYPEVPSFLLNTFKEAKMTEMPCDVNHNIQNTDDDTDNNNSSNSNNDIYSSRICGIHDVNLTIPTGSITVIYGPSGSGKSTCLRLLAGLLQPQKGTVYTHKKLALLEQQQAVLLGSVADNILMMDTNNLSIEDKNKTRIHVHNAIQHSGCYMFLDDPYKTIIHSPDTSQFSGGQLQRICMARLYARQGCTLLLLDEPTTGLDEENVKIMLNTLVELNKVYHKTIVVTTHDKRVESVAHKIIEMKSTNIKK